MKCNYFFKFKEYKNPELVDKYLSCAFKTGAKKVFKLTGAVDDCLSHGGLDTSDCAYEMEKALGVTVLDDEPWSCENNQINRRKLRGFDRCLNGKNQVMENMKDMKQILEYSHFQFIKISISRGACGLQVVLRYF